MPIRTYKYRLYPSKSQKEQLYHVLAGCRGLYNMALAERKHGYQQEGRSVSKSELYELGKHYRRTMPYGDQIFSQTAQSVIEQVDEAYQAFFRRLKEGNTGQKAGHPRFKGKNRFNSFLFKQYGAGVKIDGRRLKLFGIGRVRVRWHRPVEGVIKTVRILHKGGRWYACFACEVEEQEALTKTGRMVGLDAGISALYTTSAGEKIEHPAYYRQSQQKLRRLQRKLARARTGSKNRKKALRAVQRQQEHVANQRRNFLHKLSTQFIEAYDAIALEDLRVANMVRNRHLSKSILDSGWSIFRQMLTYKAESAGRELAFVDPRDTSRMCFVCGALFENFDLSTRWVSCACGLSLDRDHHSALAILQRAGWDTPVPDNVGPLPLVYTSG